MDSLLGAEILKTRKRWLPYVVFIFIVIALAIQVFLMGYVSWNTSEELDPYRGDSLRTFTLPYSIVTILDSGQFWGSVLVAVLTASIVATEHNWGTVRQALVRGQTRSAYLVYKLAGIVLVAATILLAGLFVGILFSIFATLLAGETVTLEARNGPSIPEIGLMILRAGFAIVPYGLMAFCLTVAARSTTLGVVGVLVYVFGEAIGIAILETIGGVAADSREISIGENVSALLAVNRIGAGDYNSLAPRELPVASELPDVWLALVVLAGYCAAFAGIAFWIFQRRDLKA